MHNIKELRKNLNIFKQKLLDRNFDLNTDLFENLDGKNRKLISEKEKEFLPFVNFIKRIGFNYE